MALACIPRGIICNPYTFFSSYECRCVQKVVKIVCLSLDMLQSVIVSGAVIYISQYPMLLVFYNTHVLLHCVIQV